jgi:hypothetical protein
LFGIGLLVVFVQKHVFMGIWVFVHGRDIRHVYKSCNSYCLFKCLVMGGDSLHLEGYSISINGLNPNYLTKLIYGVQGSFMFFIRNWTKKFKRCIISFYKSFTILTRHQTIDKCILNHSFLSIRKKWRCRQMQIESFIHFN